MLLRLLALSCLAAGCSGPAPTANGERFEGAHVGSKARVAALRAREDALRARFDPQAAAPWVDVSGPDPYRIAPSPSGGFVGILRGAKALVRLDAELTELDRIALPQTPSALCVSDGNLAWVGSRYEQSLLRVSLDGRQPVHSSVRMQSGIADIACGPWGLIYALSADGSELITVEASGHVRDRRPAMAGGLRLRQQGRYLLASSLFERSLRVWQLDPRGVPERELATLHHDGTLWAFDVLERDDQLLVAVAGVEDRPLLRAHGEFENIDSYAWIYRLRAGRFEERFAIDLSDSGVVVPKAIDLAKDGEGTTLSVLGAGSGRLLRARWAAGVDREPYIETQPAPPGVADALFTPSGEVVYASPLLDAFIKLSRAGAQLVRVGEPGRPDLQIRLGEALFFTELMAPDNVSAGSHSRFTCETCHFEGGVDGRVHYTGRADVSVVTKPLFGLANNRPHFSRAMDPDLSSVSHNEFRVAGAGSGTDPWFRLDTDRFPWLHELGVDRGQLSPLELREALLEFLYAFSHAPNPRVQGRERFSELEAEGARAFRDRCQSCHDARLKSDDAGTRVPFSAWESQIFRRNAPIVWARGDYEKTGILPYVHERGTRIPSLRRLALKPRYFTNGSSPDLESVLQRFRGNAHEGSTEAELPPRTRAALLDFLRLL